MPDPKLAGKTVLYFRELHSLTPPPHQTKKVTIADSTLKAISVKPFNEMSISIVSFHSFSKRRAENQRWDKANCGEDFKMDTDAGLWGVVDGWNKLQNEFIIANMSLLRILIGEDWWCGGWMHMPALSVSSDLTVNGINYASSALACAWTKRDKGSADEGAVAFQKSIR